MKPVEQRADPGRLGTVAELLGYLALAPLVLCLAGLGLLPQYGARELAQSIAIAWAAVLLAATGAVHLGLVLAGRLPARPARLAGATVPALLGASAVVLGGQRACALLVVGFGGFWLYEHRSLADALPPRYLGLRRSLSLATCTLLALTMIASDAAGLL